MCIAKTIYLPSRGLKQVIVNQAFRRRRTYAEESETRSARLRTVTPYLIIKDAASAIDYYKQAFKAKVLLTIA